MRNMIMSLIWFTIGVLDMCIVSNEKTKEKPDKFYAGVMGTSGVLSMLLGILYQLDI